MLRPMVRCAGDITQRVPVSLRERLITMVTIISAQGWRVGRRFCCVTYLHYYLNHMDLYNSEIARDLFRLQTICPVHHLYRDC